MKVGICRLLNPMRRTRQFLERSFFRAHEWGLLDHVVTFSASSIAPREVGSIEPRRCRTVEEKSIDLSLDCPPAGADADGPARSAGCQHISTFRWRSASMRPTTTLMMRPIALSGKPLLSSRPINRSASDSYETNGRVGMKDRLRRGRADRLRIAGCQTGHNGVGVLNSF